MKRRSYPKEVKEQILKEVEEIGSVHKVAKRHELAPTTIYGLYPSKSPSGHKKRL